MVEQKQGGRTCGFVLHEEREELVSVVSEAGRGEDWVGLRHFATKSECAMRLDGVRTRRARAVMTQACNNAGIKKVTTSWHARHLRDRYRRGSQRSTNRGGCRRGCAERGPSSNRH